MYLYHIDVNTAWSVMPRPRTHYRKATPLAAIIYTHIIIHICVGFCVVIILSAQIILPTGYSQIVPRRLLLPETPILCIIHNSSAIHILHYKRPLKQRNHCASTVVNRYVYPIAEVFFALTLAMHRHIRVGTPNKIASPKDV